MDKLTDKAFDYLKGKGKVSGGTVREDLGLSKSEWAKIKLELAEHGLVELGRGRGGTIKLLTDEKPVEEKPISKAQRMEFAREEKAYRSTQNKNKDKVMVLAQKLVESEFPDCDYWIEPSYPFTGSFIAYIQVDEGIKTHRAFRGEVTVS